MKSDVLFAAALSRSAPSEVAAANKCWRKELEDAGPVQHASLEKLRATLLRALRASAARGHIQERVIEDSVQETLLVVLEKLASFRGEGSLESWAIAIAIRHAMTAMKRQRWCNISLESLVDDGWSFSSARVTGTTQEERQMQHQMVHVLLRAVETKLTDKQRKLLLAELGGMPQSEIAIQLGMTRNGIYKLGHDARRKLKQVLLRENITPDTVAGAFGS